MSDKPTKKELETRIAALENKILQQEQTDAALRESEQRFRLAFENANIGVCLVDPKGRFIKVNSEMSKIFGYSIKELESMTVNDIAHPEDLDVSPAFIQRALSGEIERSGFEKRYVHKKGHTVWGQVVSSLVSDTQGVPLYFISHVKDITSQKQAEEALRKSEENYRLLVNNLPGIVYIGYRDWSVEFYDNRVENLTGYNMHQFNSGKMKWVDLIVQEDFEPARQIFIKSLKTDKSYVRDYRIKTKAGYIIWIRERGYIICHKNGDIRYVSGVFYDITDQKVAEETIRKSEKKYRELWEGLRNGAAAFDMEGQIIEFNPAFQKMLDYSTEEIHKLTYKDITPLKWHALETKILKEQVLIRGYSDIYEKEHIKKDGTVFPVELVTYLIQDEAGNPEGMWATISDITKRKEAETAIKESEERFRKLYQESSQKEQLYESLLNATPDAVAIYNLEGETIYINPAFTRIFGFTMEDVKGLRIPFVPESEAGKTKAGIEKVLGGEPVSGFESRRLTKNGRILDVSLSSSCYFNHQENVAGILVFLRDITESKHTEKQLLHYQKMEALGTLAGGIAHDFNNLLQAIKGYAEILLFDSAIDQPGHRELQQISHAANRGSELTRQLLTFSRKVESKKLLIDLNREVKQAHTMLKRTIPKMIEIELELEENLKTIDADPAQVEQVVMNLAINAKDAMLEGGRLIIKTEHATLDEEYSRTHPGSNPGDYVLLSVSDTGHGIAKEVLDHIYEPFFSTKELGRGTGLGLAIVYGIVKSHQGYITCHSETGKGTTIKVFFPVVDRQVEPREKETKAPIKGGSETILLVDDEEYIRDLGKQLLDKFGYKVLTAVDGESALDLYRKEQDNIHLVIVDLIMPGIGGKQCLAEILKLNQEAKVIIVSGYSDTVPVTETIEKGAKDFIAKPFDIRKILEVVRKVLDE